MRRVRAIGIISGLVGVLGMAGTVGAAPAHANCIRGEIVVHWSGQPDQTVWPESYCFYDTGLGDSTFVGADDTKGGVPTGLPDGAKVTFWAPI